MANQRDIGFCDVDDAELAKIRLGRVRTETPDFNYSWFPGGRPVGGNIITPFIYGECAFHAIGAAMTAVGVRSSPEQRIYVLGWEFDASTPMFQPSPGQPMMSAWDLIAAADRARVAVRAMFNFSHLPLNADPNGPTCQDIDDLAFGGAIHDDWKIPGRYDISPPIGEGIHHQKLVVVVGDLGVVGFIGGMDIQKDRIIQDNPNFNQPIDPQDPSKGVDSNRYLTPMHDVHLRAMGPISKDLRRIFVERWSDHPDSADHDGKGGILTVPANDPSFDVPAGLVTPNTPQQLCMVGRTYPNGAAHGMPRGYGFLHGAPGEHTAWDMIAHAIERARNYIYVEDQYLVSGRASKALASKLAGDSNFKRIIILANNVTGGVDREVLYAQYLRARFLLDLQRVDPHGARWSIHVLKGSSDPAVLESRGIFVHSKLWIFDDRYAIVGSANCDERGYTHDSECVMGVAEDDIFPETRLGFAHRLRMRLWSKHSLMPLAQLMDWRAALSLWAAPSGGSMIERYNQAADLTYALGGSAPDYIDRILASSVDPRGD